MNRRWCLGEVFLLLGVFSGFRCVRCSGDEHQLHDDLFSSYSSKVRPRHDFKDTVSLVLDFELRTINDIDEVNQIMYTVGNIIAVWNDEYLSWNQSNYGGIDHLVVPPFEVWLPDIGLANSADTFFHATFTQDFRVTIKHTGDITWEFGGILGTLCTLDLTYFPLDKQTCTIEVENWAYTTDGVNTTHGYEEVILSSASDNGIWHLEKTEVTTEYTYQDRSGPFPIPRVVFSFKLSRKSSFYLETLIIPCILILMVQLSVFWMPPDAGEKASLGITVILAFSVFQLVIADSTPDTSDYSPVISTFVMFVMTLSTISTIMSVIVLYYHHKGAASRLPQCLRIFLFKYCASALCMRSDVPHAENKIKEDSEWAKGIINNPGINPDAKKNMTISDADALTSINAQVKYLVNHLKNQEQDTIITDEWKGLAMVMDRILFWMTFIASVIGIPVILTNVDAKH